jgi:iron complex outermembrane receptor protein
MRARGSIMAKHVRTLIRAGISVAALAAAQSVLAPAAMAQAPAASLDPSQQLDEVVVTAQRRTQNLQNVPIAVTAFSANALAEQQITTTLDLGRVVPNMFSSNNVGQASANVYYIRGLGQTQSFPTFEPQVGTYVDDIYIARQNANNFALFGVDSIQVLNGPQGTLFGRNSTGGAIVVTLQKPGATFGGDVEIGGGSFGDFAGKASVNMPVSDQVLTRVSVYGDTDDGYVRDVTTHQTLNAQHDWGVRGAVTLLPKSAPNVEWNMAVDYQYNDGANLLNQPGSGGINGADRIAYSGFSTDGGALAPYQEGAKGKLGQGVLVQSFGFESSFKIKLDAGTLDIISGFRGLEQATGVDFPDTALGPAVPYDQSPDGQFTLAQELRGSQYSQEIKFSGQVGDKLTYTTGVFYLFESNKDSFGAVLNFAHGIPGLTSFPYDFADEFTKNETISEAAYAQADYKITPKLTFTFGGRETHEIKTVLATPNVPNKGFTTADILAAGYQTHLDTDQFTPRLALQYQFDPLLMGFISATRGFQGGGWNGLAFTGNTFNSFGPETVWSYETGFRSETPDKRLRFNGTLFYENVDNYQLLSDLPSAASFVTTNAASLEAYGGEFTTTWKPITHLTLNGNLGLMHALYFAPDSVLSAQLAACGTAPGATNANCGVGIVNPAGHLATPDFTPTVTAAGTAAYDFYFPSFRMTPLVGLQYVSREAVGTAGAPNDLDRSRTLLDASLTFKLADRPLSLTVACKNCTMVNYATTDLFGYRYYNTPGTWHISAAYKF